MIRSIGRTLPEEIEDMGNNVVRGVASHLVQAILMT
jgi:hypothetical protein